MLRRIVAMLVALSTMAERSASSPPPVRRAVLWILTLAFMATQHLVTDEAEAFGFETDFSAMDGFGTSDDADDLRRLAFGFAGLARILTFLIGHIHAMAEQCSATPAIADSQFEARLLPLLQALQTWPRLAVAILDTS